MKQVLLDTRSGKVSLVETPAPPSAPNRLLVRTDASVISGGTERLVIDLASKGLVGKARARPEAARQALGVVRREGLRSAVWKAQARLDHPLPLGYSLAGTVIEVGSGLQGPPPGTPVACAGAEIATHSEIVSVPPLLAVPVPDGVSQEEAAFANLGAIALHAVRLAEVEPGGTAAVIGLGLLGQLIAQILRAAGVWSLAIDPNKTRRDLAAELAGCVPSAGGEGAVATCGQRGGADAVLVAAAGTGSEVLEDAVDMARDRGRIVVVGAMPIAVDRDRMYRKELSLVVARSAGAGRYESSYEEQGVDLPVGHVRWTEGRNMEAFLDLAAQGKLAVGGLISHRFPIDHADRAYELLEKGAEPFIGIVFVYGSQVGADGPRVTDLRLASSRPQVAGRPRIGVVGAGSFGRGVLLPRLKRLPVDLEAIATATGASAAGTARRFGFARATTDARSVIEGDDIDAVVVATRHDLHAELAASSLRAGRAVYVEKPLAMDREGLLDVSRALRESTATLTVGFNRRFAPLVKVLRTRLRGSGPIIASYVVNSAPLPEESWILDPRQGGGMLLAEAGHFIDTLVYLIGSVPARVSAVPAGPQSYLATLQFVDGSVASIANTTGALGRGPKELLTLAGRGVVAHLNDYRTLSIWGGGRTRTMRRARQDKGHDGSLRAWVRSLQTGEPSMAPSEIMAVTETTILLAESARTGKWLPLGVSPMGL